MIAAGPRCDAEWSRSTAGSACGAVGATGIGSTSALRSLGCGGRTDVARLSADQRSDGFADRLARTIAELPDGTIAAVKHALPPQDLAAGMLREHEARANQFGKPAAEKLLRGALAAGAQTPDGERHLEELLRSIEVA